MTETSSPATPERRPGAPEHPRSLPARLALHYRQVVNELRKVIWPTRRELATYTVVVLIFVLILMALVGVADLGLAKLAFAVFA